MPSFYLGQMEFENNHSETNSLQLLQTILNGYASFLAAYLPKGWRGSDCVQFFHPTAGQQYEEGKRISENLQRLSRHVEKQKPIQQSDFEQDLSDVNEEKEPITLLGLCLWDIFSDNHRVIDLEGRQFDLGSFRGSAGLIAELLNGQSNDDGFNMDYLDYYMGTTWIQKRGNLQPFYEYIFGVLKSENCNWIYAFPRMGLVNFTSSSETSHKEYDPAKALEKELANKEVDDLQQKLDLIYEAEYEEAKYKKPANTVLAYHRALLKTKICIFI